MSTLTVIKGSNANQFAVASSATWDNLTTATNGATEAYLPVSSLAVATIQVTGTFGSATVTLLGSNDGTNYVAVKDATGTALSFTSAGVAELSSAFAYYKPNLSGGSSDDIDVTIVHWSV